MKASIQIGPVKAAFDVDDALNAGTNTRFSSHKEFMDHAKTIAQECYKLAMESAKSMSLPPGAIPGSAKEVVDARIKAAKQRQEQK